MCNNCKIIEDTRLEMKKEHGTAFWSFEFKEWKENNKDIINTLSKGLDWFKINNPKAYMVLLD